MRPGCHGTASIAAMISARVPRPWLAPLAGELALRGVMAVSEGEAAVVPGVIECSVLRLHPFQS